MARKDLFLVCNAHIDPVWLWEWEEGLAETLSTFRTAARLCEEFRSFLFNHNEALLYSWVETHEPALFEKLKSLVAIGKWHVMGGWYLQPDCNMPCGESLVRQILIGKNYFRDRFGVEPKTAVNLDSFGHSRGLVQILAKSGYTSYLFCRPDSSFCDLPSDDFIWVGYDGSEVIAHRAASHYNSSMGTAREKAETCMREHSGTAAALLLWGIGNHGGGPSREDLAQLESLGAEQTGWHIRHAAPEAYFGRIEQKRTTLPRHYNDLNPWAVGCYSTMHLVKQGHRLLENRYFLTEKMATGAACQDLMEYPRRELRDALEDLLFVEFHDILPGTSIEEVENYALRRIGHGLEILSRLRAKSFFALLAGEKEAVEGEFPICVYNPHPFHVHDIIVCEFEPPEPNPDRTSLLVPELRDCSGSIIPYQLEKESSNIANDHRKRISFAAELQPASMNRFSCMLHARSSGTGIPTQSVRGTPFITGSETCEVEINRETGLIDRYCVKGIELLEKGAFRPIVLQDDQDPWGMRVQRFGDVIGGFTLMSPGESARFSGLSVPSLTPVHVVEDGPVRTVVEVLMKYSSSRMCMRYMIPKSGDELELQMRVYWNEKDRMLKLSIPTRFTQGVCTGQVACGRDVYDTERRELPAQKWVAVSSRSEGYAFAVMNDSTYGFDYARGELRLSLLRSPAYSGHPVNGAATIVPQDRFEPRIDQGERTFRFWFVGGDDAVLLSGIDRRALVKNESPMALCCYPSGAGHRVRPGLVLSDDAIQVTAFKMAEQHEWLIIRLFEPEGHERHTKVTIPWADLEFDLSFEPFEIKTIAVDLLTRRTFEVDLMENPME
jgi:alpha-mannosidase